MNGISLAMSKSCCPMYNFGTSNKSHLIPCRLPNLQHQQRVFPSVATKPMLKHRVYSYSAFKDDTGSKFEAIITVDLSVVLAVCITGMALVKAWRAVAKFVSTKGWKGVVNSNALCYIIIGVAAFCVARSFYANVMSGSTVLRDKPFSIGDIIEVGQLRGRVFEMGLITTSLLTAEEHLTEVPTAWLKEQAILNRSQTPSLPMNYKLFVKTDKIEKVPQISKEIREMMRLNKFIHLEKGEPYCYLTGLEPGCVELTLGCHLKVECNVKLSNVGHDIRMRSLKIIKKHGAALGDQILH